MKLHTDLIRSTQFLTDNKIASCSKNSIKINNLINGKCLKTLIGHTNDVVGLEKLSHRRLVSCSADRSIRIWNIETGECLKVIEDALDLADKDVGGIKLLPNEQLLSCSGKTIKLWDLNSSMRLQTLIGHENEISSVDVLSDGRVVSISDDSTVKIWNLSTGECLQTLRGHSDAVYCLKVLQDDTIITGSSDRTLKLWDLTSNSCIKTLNGHVDSIFQITTMSNNQVVSCARDGTIKVWDLLEGKCIKTLDESVLSIQSF